MIRHLGKLRLGESGLAHLGRLAHGDVALCQWPLGERLGSPIQADLTVWHVTNPLVPRTTDPLAPATARFTLHSDTTFHENRYKHVEHDFSPSESFKKPQISERQSRVKMLPAAGPLV